MKIILIFCSLFIIPFCANTQDVLKKNNPISRNTLYTEFFGNTSRFSLNYDRILLAIEDVKLSTRIGIGYRKDGKSNKYYGEKIIFPLETNLVFGYQNCAEIGYGYAPFMKLHSHVSDYYDFPKNTLRLGYRYQKLSGGFFLRAAYLIPFNFKGDEFIRLTFGLGYTFKNQKTNTNKGNNIIQEPEKITSVNHHRFKFLISSGIGTSQKIRFTNKYESNRNQIILENDALKISSRGLNENYLIGVHISDTVGLNYKIFFGQHPAYSNFELDNGYSVKVKKYRVYRAEASYPLNKILKKKFIPEKLNLYVGCGFKSTDFNVIVDASTHYSPGMMPTYSSNEIEKLQLNTNSLTFYGLFELSKNSRFITYSAGINFGIVEWLNEVYSYNYLSTETKQFPIANGPLAWQTKIVAENSFNANRKALVYIYEKNRSITSQLYFRIGIKLY